LATNVLLEMDFWENSYYFYRWWKRAISR